MKKNPGTVSLAALKKSLEAAAPAGTMWLVGGCLRDVILKRPLKDVDAAVSGDPEKAAKKFGALAGGKPFPLDAERGIYRVVQKSADGERTFDFCRLQGKTIERDLSRRDFTINALALPLEKIADPALDKNIIDPHGGRKDLKSRLIRVVAEKAFIEDPLRLLRAFRFAAELDFKIEAKTAASIKSRSKLSTKSAPERIREELYKILSSPRAAGTFRLMDKAGLLTVIFPEGEDMRKTAHEYYGKEGVLGHSIAAMESLEWLMDRWEFFFPEFHKPLADYMKASVGGFPRYALLKLTEWLHDVGKPATAKKENGKLHFYGHDAVGRKIAEKISRRLRFSNEESLSLGRLVHAHMRPGNLGHQPVLTDRAVYRFFRDLEDDAVGMLVVALADHFTYLSEKEKTSREDPVFSTIHKMLAAHFLRPAVVHPPKIIDGHFIMKKLNIKEGPEIGRLLEAVREAQSDGRIKTQSDALNFVRKSVQELKSPRSESSSKNS